MIVLRKKGISIKFEKKDDGIVLKITENKKSTYFSLVNKEIFILSDKSFEPSLKLTEKEWKKINIDKDVDDPIENLLYVIPFYFLVAFSNHEKEIITSIISKFEYINNDMTIELFEETMVVHYEETVTETELEDPPYPLNKTFLYTQKNISIPLRITNKEKNKLFN